MQYSATYYTIVIFVKHDRNFFTIKLEKKVYQMYHPIIIFLDKYKKCIQKDITILLDRKKNVRMNDPV